MGKKAMSWLRHLWKTHADHSSSIDHFNWLSLLPRRLKAVGAVCRFSRSDWQLTHNRTPGIALRRASGIKVPHSSQWVEP
jgi:hypothetical protein